jgi:hypothetical protein
MFIFIMLWIRINKLFFNVFALQVRLKSKQIRLKNANVRPDNGGVVMTVKSRFGEGAQNYNG